LVEEFEAHAEVALNADWISKDPVEDDTVVATFVYHDCDEATLEWALGRPGRSCRAPSTTDASRWQPGSQRRTPSR
jgi:hypothetical protein